MVSRFFLKVNAVPRQAQGLAQTQTSKDNHFKQCSKTIISRLRHHFAHLPVSKGLDFFAVYTGQRYRFGGIPPDILQFDSRREAFAEDTV